MLPRLDLNLNRGDLKNCQFHTPSASLSKGVLSKIFSWESLNGKKVLQKESFITIFLIPSCNLQMLFLQKAKSPCGGGEV